MPKNNFLLVSLEDKQSKQLAEVLNNPSARKIINYLSEHDEATETDIAKKLNIPLSTVHYNLQKLKQAQLVTVEHFTYSKKGREVDHYRLENKYVIITPKPVKGIRSALKSILPVGLIIMGIATVLQFTQQGMTKTLALVETADFALTKPQSAEMVAASARAAPDISIALWFLIGAGTALLLYGTIALLVRRIQK